MALPIQCFKFLGNEEIRRKVKELLHVETPTASDHKLRRDGCLIQCLEDTIHMQLQNRARTESLPTVSLLAEGSSCLTESCKVLTVVGYEVICTETFIQLLFCSLNNFTGWFRFLSGAGRAEHMRTELKHSYGHPILINTEEAVEAGFDRSMVRFSCEATFSSTLSGTVGFWACEVNDTVIAYVDSSQNTYLLKKLGVSNKQINQTSVEVKETDHDGCYKPNVFLQT